MTPETYPYVLVIGVYNEAGEQVKSLYFGDVKGGLEGSEIKIDGEEEKSVFMQDSLLEIFLPGIEEAGSSDKDGMYISWDGKTAQGQPASQGVYYLQISRRDSYDHVDSVVKNFTILRDEEFVEMRIFNSAGEIVKSIKRNESIAVSDVSIDIDAHLVIGESASPEKLKYCDSCSFEWDGKSARGSYVSTGVYEVQFIFKTDQGTLEASKKVMVINTGENELGEVKAYPNPCGGSENLTIEWSGGGAGYVTIYIYNLAGDLVKKIASSKEEGKAEWDGRTKSGEKAASGVYAVVIRADGQEGYAEKKMVKVVLAGE